MDALSITADELSKHAKNSDCWISFGARVYDVTPFLNRHPGGSMVLLQRGGKDALQAFEDAGHSQYAHKLLDKFEIGQLVGRPSACPFGHGGRNSTTDLATKLGAGISRDSHAAAAVDSAAIGSDNVWLRDSPGGRPVGDSGSRFSPASFTLDHFVLFMWPCPIEIDESIGAGVRYWNATKKSGSNLRVRNLRFHISYLASFLAFICGSPSLLAPLYQGSISKQIELATLGLTLGGAIAGAYYAIISRCAFGHLVVSFIRLPVLLMGIIFPVILVSLMSVASLGHVAWRCALFFWLTFMVLFPYSPTASGGSWFQGAIALDRRLLTGLMLACPCFVEVAILGRGGQAGDMISILIFGFSVSSFIKLIPFGIQSARNMSAVLDCAVAVVAAFTALAFRYVALTWGLVKATETMGDGFGRLLPSFSILVAGAGPDGFIGIHALSFIAFVVIVRLYGWILVMSGFHNPPIASAHLQTIPVGLALYFISLLYELGYAALDGRDHWAACLVVFWGVVNLFKYCNLLTENSVKRFDLEPVGKSYVNLCKKSVKDPSDAPTVTEIEAELGMSAVWAMFSMFLAHVIATFARAITAVASSLLFRNLTFYLHPTPVVDLRDTGQVEMGIAYCTTPADGQQRPHTFVCNVGHMENDSNSDWLTTNMHTYRMVDHLAKDPHAGSKGFVSNIICEFHRKAATKLELRSRDDLESGKVLGKETGRTRKPVSMVRQVNLSVWSSAKAAHDWYTASQAHKDIVKMFKNGSNGHGSLETFSSLLAHLSPTEGRPLRWYAKCKACGALQKRYPDSTTCPKCGAHVSMPFYV